MFSYDLAFSRNIGWLTPDEQRLLSAKKIAIAGLGGVGGMHLLALTRLGVGRFHLADFDEFALENFNRQVGAKLSTIGRKKLDTMVDAALDINPDLEVTSFSEGVTLENLDAFLEGVDVYVDGLDFFAVDIRRAVFARAYELGIPCVTAAPLGMGVSNLNFLPGKMSFEDYFQLEGREKNEQYLRFFVGLSPAGLHRSYLMIRDSIDLNAKKGPSTVIGCELCAGVAATQTLKLLLNRGRVAPAPYCLQIDAYTNKSKLSWRPWGNRHPLNRMALYLGKKLLKLKPSEAPGRPATAAHRVLERARWTPSGDNDQGWRFKILSEDGFEIHGSTGKGSNFYDLDGRSSYLSHGALLENVRLAASSLGYATSTRIKTVDSDHAVYRVDLARDVHVGKDPLEPYIEMRACQRKPMGTRSLSPKERRALEQSLPAGYRVHWLEDWQQRLRLGKLLYSWGALRLSLKECFDVHRNIVDWNCRFSEDKIPEKALGLDPISTRVLKWALSSWNRYRSLVHSPLAVLPRLELDLLPALFCSAHFVLYSQEPGRGLEEDLRSGKAMQRFWLAATSLGLGLQPQQIPIIVSNYLGNGLSFAEEPSARVQAGQLDDDLKALLPAEVFQGKVFMGRVGRSAQPKSRSLRKPISVLLED